MRKQYNYLSIEQRAVSGKHLPFLLALLPRSAGRSSDFLTHPIIMSGQPVKLPMGENSDLFVLERLLQGRFSGREPSP